MLTHCVIAFGGNIDYIFQPKGLNPETLEPVPTIWFSKARVDGGEEIEVDVPMDILGSKGEDLGTGFKGKIVSLIYHITGCLHVEIKPEGVLKSTGATVKPYEFDIRRVKGPKIKVLGEKKLEESIKKAPSPMRMGDRIH